MTEKTILDTDQEKQQQETLDNLQMIEYLASEQHLQGKTLELAINIRKAFREQRSLSTAINYEKLLVDGGKQDPNWEIILQSNRRWNEFENLLKHHAKFIENMICIEKPVAKYRKELGDLKLMEIISEICFILEQLVRFLSSDWELLIMEIGNEIRRYGGIKPTARDTKISRNTIKKIINGDKNINLNSLERLVRFFKVENVRR